MSNDFLIVEFSGWCKIPLDKVKFIDLDGEPDDHTISGIEWAKLTPERKASCILEDVIAVQRDCEDGDYEEISYEVEKFNVLG
jgi:uncharacterized protein (DUF927 family)